MIRFHLSNPVSFKSVNYQKMRILWSVLLFYAIGCHDNRVPDIDLLLLESISIDLPHSVSINSFKATSNIHTVEQDTFLTFLDEKEQAIYVFTFNNGELKKLPFERVGPNRIKSEPSLVKMLSNEEMAILCHHHIKIIKRDKKDLQVLREYMLSNDSTDLNPGSYYWYEHYTNKDLAFLFEFDYSTARYSDFLLKFYFSDGKTSKITVPDHYVALMNEDKSTGRIRTSEMLPQVSILNDEVPLFSSWYSNRVYLGEKEVILTDLYNHLDLIKAAKSNEKISQIQSEEGFNGTLLYNEHLELFIGEKMYRNKETGRFKREVCFFNSDGETINCLDSKGMLKYHTDKHLFYLNIDEANDKAVISIYELINEEMN